MAKSYFFTCLAVASCLWGLVAAISSSDAYAAECLRKTAGFYLADMNVSGAHNLRALQNLSGSLTGLPGNPELGRDVFVNAQKGGCVSCHQLSTLPAAIAQGSVGPALDGTGSKYSEGQLRQVLLQPDGYFPETIMPSYYRPGEAAQSVLTAAEVEDLVAYLGTLK
jgi:L-cysteine S-thiosulfotransferase